MIMNSTKPSSYFVKKIKFPTAIQTIVSYCELDLVPVVITILSQVSAGPCARTLFSNPQSTHKQVTWEEYYSYLNFYSAGFDLFTLPVFTPPVFTPPVFTSPVFSQNLILCPRWSPQSEKGTFVSFSYLGGTFGSVITFPLCGEHFIVLNQNNISYLLKPCQVFNTTSQVS